MTHAIDIEPTRYSRQQCRRRADAAWRALDLARRADDTDAAGAAEREARYWEARAIQLLYPQERRV